MNRLEAIQVRCRCGERIIVEYDPTSYYKDGWGRRQCKCGLYVTCDSNGRNVEFSDYHTRGDHTFVTQHPNRKHNVKYYVLDDAQKDFYTGRERYEHPHGCGHDFWEKDVAFGDVVQCTRCKGFFVHARQQVWCYHKHTESGGHVFETYKGGVDAWKGGVWYPVNVQERQ